MNPDLKNIDLTKFKHLSIFKRYIKKKQVLQFQPYSENHSSSYTCLNGLVYFKAACENKCFTLLSKTDPNIVIETLFKDLITINLLQHIRDKYFIVIEGNVYEFDDNLFYKCCNEELYRKPFLSDKLSITFNNIGNKSGISKNSP